MTYSVIICDNSPAWADELEKIINQSRKYYVRAKTCSGKAALEYIVEYRPEIVMLGFALSEYDGLYLVDFIRNELDGYNPVIYIVSEIGTPQIVSAFSGYNVDFISLRPVSTDLVARNLNIAVRRRRLNDDSARLSPNVRHEFFTNREYAKEYTAQLGLLCSHKATLCLREALALSLDEPSVRRLLSKLLYPQVAKCYDLSIGAVEKNIRNAIAMAQRNGTDFYNKMFAYAHGRKISITEFISVSSEYLQDIIRNAG